uniref:BTB/POZ domain-containing protein n=1 Tax=Oryzias sinensis TaxID=183150 RepID=A0A8C7YX05_9TELE
MKPDGVATAALEPIETLESNTANEEAPPTEQEPNQATAPAEQEMLQQPAEGSATKTSSKKSAEPKARATNKGTAKTQPGSTSSPKPISGPRTSTPQNRIANGVTKPQMNGAAKKTAPAVEKKSTPTPASSKKPAGAGATVPKTPAKVGEKKAVGLSVSSNSSKAAGGAAAVKKPPSTTANGLKSNTAAAAAKKPPGEPSLHNACLTDVRCGVTVLPFSFLLVRATSTPTRPTTGSSQSATTPKSPMVSSKPATPKTPSNAGKPATSKSASTCNQSLCCFFLDVTKPSTPAARKPADSPLTRPSSSTKSSKPETPKSSSKLDATAKKSNPNKISESKTPNRTKTQEGRATPSKNSGTKPAAAKTTSPKKTVGSSTPTPVKRAPKPAAADGPGKEVAAAVAAAAAIATATAVAAEPEGLQPQAEAHVEVPAAAREETPEAALEPVPESQSACEAKPKLLQEPAAEPMQEPTPQPVRVPTPEPLREPTPEPVREPTPEPMEPTPEPLRVPTPEPMRIPTPEPMRIPTPEPIRVPTPEPMRIPIPEPIRVPTPEQAREPTPNYLQESTSEVVQKLTLEYLREPTPEPTQEETEHESSPYQILEPSSEILVGPPQPSAAAELGSSAAQMEHFQFQDTTNNSFPSLGTTVMSPPCSPPGPASPVRQPQSASPLLRVDVHSDSWARSQDEEEEQEGQEMKGKEEDEEREKENLFLPPLSAPGAFDAAAQLHFLGASPPGVFIPGDLTSPGEKEEAVEKADEEINEDDEDDEEEDEQKRLGHQLSSMITDMSSSQPSDEFQVRSSVFGGSAGWHGDDLLSGMDSEDVSSCTSSRQPGVSDLSSTLHTAILEGTQSSDALVDSSLRGSEGDGNLMGSPNVETLANEEEEDEDEEDERVDDMDMSSERVEEQHGLFKERDQNEEEEEDEDVEMHSEGLVESGGNMDEDGFNEEERSENINLAGLPPCAPPISSWSQNNPFSDTWSQPASLLSVSSPSPVSDHGAAESETPTQSPAQACLDSGAPSFAPQTEHQPGSQPPEYSPLMGVASEEAPDLLAAPAVGVSQSSTLSGGALAAHSSSETSTPEELQDYDSSSGVESRSDKQQTPVPASLQPDVDQDLGIHMEKGDGEEEEAETLPADEVPGTGPPTAPASDPSSPSTSGDDASDTEGEIQINDPETPIKMDAGVEFQSPSPTCGLPALEEEAGNTAAGEGEEDGGGTTPQSANSVASYGFDCTTSNSNAHSMAESCGKSPGIFSLENEEQLPEEAKDPSLIKELTLPSAAAARPEDLLGGAVDLMPLSHTDYPSLDERHYLLGGKLVAEHVEGPQEPGQHTRNQEAEDRGDFQPPYFSTVCDKTDSFLEGNKSTDEEEEHTWQSDSQEDNWNQNQTAFPVANCHYLALVPGNRRPIDPALAEHFAEIAPPPPLKGNTGEQLRGMEQTQEEVKEMQETQKREWLEEERLRLEQQRLLERQRRELLQLQLQQQQQNEHRHRRQLLQWQLELEHQYRMQQKQMQQQQQLRRSPTGVMLSPSSGLCTIYESMETSDEEDEAGQEPNKNLWLSGTRVPSPQYVQRQPRPVPPQDLEWNQKVDMVQQLINQTLLLSGDGGCPPLLLLPVGTGGILSPLESSMWPSLPPQFSPPAATVTSVSSYSPDSRSSSPSGDWTVVELETQH